MQILIADDKALIRQLVSKHLSKWGHEVIACEDGEQAWEALQKIDAPKLAILDWEMPGIDGVSLCKKLVETESTKDVYAILLTSREETDDIVEGLEAGAADYITKPFEESELRARVNVGISTLKLQNKLVDFERMKTLTLTVGAAAHEINQPLTVIIGNSDMLSIKIQDIEGLQKYVDSI